MADVAHPIRVALIGWGAIGRATARLLGDVDAEIVAVATSDASRERVDLPAGAVHIDEPARLAAARPDIVIEAAGRAAVEPWALASLAIGSDYVVSSVSALADADLLEALRRAAVMGSAHLVISSGALAGIDAVAAARVMGIDHVEHRVVKPPHAWSGTPAEALVDLDGLTEATTFFTGTADEAATSYPQNANATMTTALAGIGASRTRVALVADPAAELNRHEISASGAFGRLDVSIANTPLEENPKSSAMAALSLVRIIHNRAGAISI